MRHSRRLAVVGTALAVNLGSGIPAPWGSPGATAPAVSGISLRDPMGLRNTRAATPLDRTRSDARTLRHEGSKRRDSKGSDREARREQALPASAPRVAIWAAPGVPGDVTFRVWGEDAGAPRDLDLWRRGARGNARIARGHSLPDGTLRFPRIARSDAAMEIVAAPPGASPLGPSASQPLWLQAPEPAAPEVQLLARAGERAQVRIWPRYAGGTVAVFTDGESIGRFAVSAAPGGVPRAVDLDLVGISTSVEIEYESLDGRNSPRRVLRLREDSESEGGGSL